MLQMLLLYLVLRWILHCHFGSRHNRLRIRVSSDFLFCHPRASQLPSIKIVQTDLRATIASPRGKILVQVHLHELAKIPGEELPPFVFRKNESPFRAYHLRIDWLFNESLHHESNVPSLPLSYSSSLRLSLSLVLFSLPLSPFSQFFELSSTAH